MGFSKGKPREALSTLSPLSKTSFKASPPTTPEMEEAINKSESIITKWDPTSSHITSLFDHSTKEAKLFIDSVHSLRHSMHFLIFSDNTLKSRATLVLGQTLLQSAMKRLEKELYHILSSSLNGANPKIDDESSSDLKSIVECMMGCGYGKECIKIYKIIRKSIVDEALYNLGVQKLKLLKIQKMSPESRQRLIDVWLDALKQGVTKILRNEKALCDSVFSSSNSLVRESCFFEITKEGSINLFKFPELIAKTKGTTLDSLIQLYETLFELWPDIEYIFNFSSTAIIKLQALSSLVKLGNAVQTVLCNYEASIMQSPTQTPAGGGIHPLTESAMDFVSKLGDYGGTLSDILSDHPNRKLPESYFIDSRDDEYPTSPLSLRIAWLILVLLCKLDIKADIFKDVSLSYLFLANNLNFIVQKVSTTNLKYLLGDDWVTRKRIKVQQYVRNYEATSWDKVVAFLEPASSSIEQIKECLGRFSFEFQEVYRRQSGWVVSDGKLRGEIRVSLVNKMVGKYRGLYQQCFNAEAASSSGVTSDDDSLVESVRFGPDDLENYLSGLLCGTPAVFSGSLSLSNNSATFKGCLPR